MVLCQEFDCLPEEGALRDQDAFIIRCWLIMMDAFNRERKKQMDKESKKTQSKIRG